MKHIYLWWLFSLWQSFDEQRRALVNDHKVLAKQDLKFFILCSINDVGELMSSSRSIWIFFLIKYCHLNCIVLFYMYYLFRIWYLLHFNYTLHDSQVIRGVSETWGLKVQKLCRGGDFKHCKWAFWWLLLIYFKVTGNRIVPWILCCENVIRPVPAKAVLFQTQVKGHQRKQSLGNWFWSVRHSVYIWAMFFLQG